MTEIANEMRVWHYGQQWIDYLNIRVSNWS